MSVRMTEHAQRVFIVEQHLAGVPLPEIADALQLNRYTARKWWRVYREHGWAGLVPQPAGPPARGPLSHFDPLVKYVALRLKREHPGWGLDPLLLEMSRRPSVHGLCLPKRTALWTYLHSFHPRLAEHRRLHTQRPAQTVLAVRAVHQRWQMDFKGDVVIEGVGAVRPFIVCDEFTSAPLAGIIHAVPGPDGGLTCRDVQADLRLVLAQWGLPDELRMDRDPLWVGSTRLEWPGTLLLWLVGLAVTPVINRPHCPTDNARVERGNRVWYEHVGLGAHCQTVAEVQALTDQAWRDRREALPSRNPNCAGQPPLRAHPELAQPRRAYTVAQEAQLFDIQRVYTYLSQWEWQRKVDVTGSISMADYNRRVSVDHIGQVVKIRFDPDAHEFVARAVDGTELRRFTLPVISAEYIMGLAGGT